MTGKIKSTIVELSPAYFAMVMATGIVSIASDLTGFEFLARPLLWLNVGFYTVLWALNLGRVCFFPRHFLADLTDHTRGAGYFTAVAGTCILGNQFVVLMEAQDLGALLLVLGVVLWILLIYAVLTAFTIRPVKPSLGDGITGGWLVATVSTQSVSVLSGRLASHFASYEPAVLFFSLCMFLIGSMLYLIVITLIFYRFMFFPLKPQGFEPLYWISMGAAAITTLAGTILALNGHGSQLLQPIAPFILGSTILFWAFATWWIPLLVLLEVWRHVVHRVKLSYTPQYWSLVFPLGMYTTCTVHLSKVMGWDALLIIPNYFIYAALFAWGITVLGLVKSLCQSLLVASFRPDQ
jgi:tellurite resistance protein TehA-like permease